MTYNIHIIWILVLHAELMKFSYCFTRAMYKRFKLNFILDFSGAMNDVEIRLTIMFVVIFF